MFINLKTGRAAWLIEQDQDGSVLYSHDAPTEAHRHHTGTPAGEFFAAHREATPDEVDEHTPARKKAAPKSAAKKPAKPKAAKKPAARKPSGLRKPRKAAPASTTTPAPDKSAAASPGAAAGES